MKCPNCNREYYDIHQKICEYCGSDLVKNTQKTIENTPEPKKKLDSFLDDLGLKDIYKKIKKNLREL